MKQIVALIGLGIAMPLWSFGQQSPTISGTIRSARLEPLPGISIKVKHTGKGAITNGSGQYTLAATPQDTLLISGIGYQLLQVPVNGRTKIAIQLEEDATALGEVVVVGYGTQKKSDLTGSVTSISAEQFRKTPSVSLDNGLRGRAAGVQVTAASNQPGGVSTIRIRGNNSVNTGSEPLYVIDGFPVYNDNSGAGASAGPKLNALSLINPNDIVSIEVLKDASAAAIYGARGANGVVLVTTKKGETGATKIEFNTYYGTQEAAKKLPLLNATEFAQLVNDANGTTVFTPQQIAAFGKGTDWQHEVLRKAPLQNYQLAASGGDARTKYAVSLNYYNQQGIIINSDFSRYSTRFNFERQATTRLSFGSNLTIARTNANQALSATGGGEGTIGVIGSALAFSPILPVYKADGTYVLENDRGIPMGNPVATAKELTNNSVNNRVLGNIYASYKILAGLEFRTSIGADILSTKEKYYAPRTTLRGYSLQGIGSASSANATSLLNENTLTYKKQIAKHSLTALAGFTVQQYQRDIVTSSASGFVNDLLGADNLGSGAIVNTPVTNVNTWSLASFIGRINYAWNNKYLLTLTARADGSSKFGANNKYGYFPSGSVAWKLSEEEFIKDLNVFHELKLRGSYGKTGNQEINSYQSLAGLSNMSYIIGDNVVKGYAPGNIPNKDLKWETTSQSDIGLDASFFRGRLTVTADAYYKKTTDMLLWVNVPWSTGFTSALQNIGSVENKGLELAVSALITDRKLRWNTTFNISANRNKVLSLGPIEQILTGEINGYLKISDPIVIRPGQPLNAFYGYVSDGIFQLKDDIAGSAQPTAKPGDRRYKDVLADGKLDAKDRQYIGNAQPKFFGGMTHDFAWNNFDLSASFNWVYGNTILNSTRAELDLPTGQKNSSARVKDRWTPTNPSNSIPRASLNRSFLFSDAQLEDGSYFRLGNLSLGYNLPRKWLQAAHLERLRVYVAAQNLFTITHYTGYDPETNQSGQDNILRGIDSDAYPSAKTYMVGINLGL
ncbi:SusC/RagA family TonB-linked outer membrane protein [Chitinophaga arvensicola]|uniref:TonB-linked outer membrane protein, SusC/RagA family n=1 Tax=Chitinophaga arvensicola TaxID=29529 RepID=A0A1I0RM66_9BACT|nr:TonB-dependent receptor [Chitinophaga arvensicola]SEW42214.1 TonB-linked outer membrane protein, SusC/RagA family [Chitinophaga arvensicola]